VADGSPDDAGVEALRSIPRALTTRRVFHVEGRPISWGYFSRDVRHPALLLAGLDPRAPYNLRHSHAWHRLQAGVPIATLARQMGHADVSRTFIVYGGWSREMGENAASLRETWVGATNTPPHASESPSDAGVRVPPSALPITATLAR
jgi:hypothetical protein